MPSLSALLPCIGALSGLATIAIVYHLTAQAGHLPEGVPTPPISFLGLKSPEHEAYQFGFALTGAMLLVCVNMVISAASAFIISSNICFRPLMPVQDYSTSSAHEGVSICC